jgi:hypothetical protein
MFFPNLVALYWKPVCYTKLFKADAKFGRGFDRLNLKHCNTIVMHTTRLVENTRTVDSHIRAMLADKTSECKDLKARLEAGGAHALADTAPFPSS